MDFKKYWLYLSVTLATSIILFSGLLIPHAYLDGKFGLDYYHFIILGLILCPFLYSILIKKVKEKKFPNYFLWFLIFISIGIIPFLYSVRELYLVLFGPCSDFCGLILIFTAPVAIISSIISIIFFLKSKRLS